jgi:hypothetical protein
MAMSVKEDKEEKRDIKSVEDYLIEKLNAKYAQRVFQKINTEYEKLTMEMGSEPNIKEYDWMVNRALEIHREMNKEGKA